MNVLTERKPFYSREAVSYLSIADIDSGEVSTLREFDHCVEAPNWTRDGRLVFNARGAIQTYDPRSGEIEIIDTGYANRCNNDHVLSSDGEWLAVSHHTVEDGLSRIYTLRLSGGAPRLVTPIAPSFLHGWSPDGTTLAYCAERNGKYDIYTIPTEGGEETRLTDSPGLSDGPEYSPCGKFIWFNSTRGGLMQLYRMNADGSNQTQITSDDRNNWFGHVSPDGRFVAYVSYNAAEVKPNDHPANKRVEIRIIPATGGQPRVLVSLFGGQGTMNVNSWSPDSKRLAFVRYQEVK